jgi:serine/threonine protein kinase
MTCHTCGTEYPADVRFCPNDGSVLWQMEGHANELVGRIIDERYYLERKVGQGGMGEVYLGEHVRTRRRCAVKIINRSLARDSDALNRFIREATNAGRISHPHVAAIYDFGETDDGLLYLAMEYVDGPALSNVLENEGSLSPARAVEIARQVADGVAAAHELGIVHRDLKPSNIMLARDRRGRDVVKVVDFGIARAVGDDEQRLTRTGLVIGTPEYMSPEHLIGDPVEARSDIYSLGCVLYQMLTGEHAFGGSAAHVITRRLTEPPPRPREKNPAIPKPLDDLIVTALGRTPAERFLTMDAMREALLSAPTQPVTTGPRRLASWLGLSGDTSERTVEKPVPTPADRGNGANTDGQHPSTDSSGVAPESEILRPSARDDLSVEKAAGEPDDLEREHGFDEFATDDGVPADDLYFDADLEDPVHPTSDAFRPDGNAPDRTDRTDFRTISELLKEGGDTRRRNTRVAAALGTGGIGALLLVAVVVWRAGQAEIVSSRDSEFTVDPVLIEQPPIDTLESTLSDLRGVLALAEEQDRELEFALAIGLLRSVDGRLAFLSELHPDVAEIRALADSVRSYSESVERRCDTLRRVAIARNALPPVCEPEG